MTIKNLPKNCCSTVDEKPAELGSICLLHRTEQRRWCCGSHENYILLQGKKNNAKLFLKLFHFESNMPEEIKSNINCCKSFNAVH